MSSTTPVGGVFDRTITVANIPVVTGKTIEDNTEYRLVTRFLQAGPSGGNTIVAGVAAPAVLVVDKHYIHELHKIAVGTLSIEEFEVADLGQVYAENGTITVSGDNLNLDGVYSLTGQKVGNTNLANGVYLVKVSKGAKQATVKVILQ